jgi:thiamine-phosphate pyrophosphorylase
VFSIYLITNDEAPDALVAHARAALAFAAPDRVALQLRAKSLSAARLLDVAARLRELTRHAHAKLIINDRLDIAQLVGADGVQLPEAGIPVARARALLGDDVLIGASCHDAVGLARAQAQGASFATLSPVFEVEGKGAPLGMQGFADLVSRAKLPVYALGGLAPAHTAELRARGASGMAVIRAVFAADDPARALAECLAAWDATDERTR